MSTIIIIESRPLILRGIVQLISETVPACQIDVATQNDLHQNNSNPIPLPLSGYALMVLSLVVLDDAATQIIATATQVYRPKSIIVLSDALVTVPQDLPSNVVGCVPIHASPDILQAAITLALTDEAPGAESPFERHPPVIRPAIKSLPAPTFDTKSLISATPHYAQQESKNLGLTPRQYEVLVLLARGYTLKAIAHHLNIAAATAKVHAETVYQRLHVHSRTEAVYAAISRGATLGWPRMANEIRAYAGMDVLAANDQSG